MLCNTINLELGLGLTSCVILCFWIGALGLQMHLSLQPSAPFFLSFFLPIPNPPRFYSFHFPSMHSVCVLLINTSLCLPAGVSDGHSWAESCGGFSPVYSSPSICPSPPSQGFVPFSAAINLLANRPRSCRLGAGIRFLALRTPKNVGAWN